MATIQVDDIQVAKSGQWHSLRGQKIAQDSQWKTFDTGCGVAKSGDWYVLKEQGYQVELLLTTKPDDMGNLVVYPTVLLNKPLEEDAEITVSFRQDIEPGQEITIYGLAGETVLYSYDYCIIYSSGFYDSLNVRQVEIEWSEPHTVVKRAMKTGYLYDDVIARTLFGIPIASTEDVSFDITTENDEYFEGIVTISAGSCFKITNYNLDYKEYNIANIVPGSITDKGGNTWDIVDQHYGNQGAELEISLVYNTLVQTTLWSTVILKFSEPLRQEVTCFIKWFDGHNLLSTDSSSAFGGDTQIYMSSGNLSSNAKVSRIELYFEGAFDVVVTGRKARINKGQTSNYTFFVSCGITTSHDINIVVYSSVLGNFNAKINSYTNLALYSYSANKGFGNIISITPNTLTDRYGHVWDIIY